MFNIGTRLTTLIIAATTNPSPIPDRKRIERVPAVFSGIIFVLKTKILIRDVIVRHTRYVPSYRRWGRRGGRRRRRWWSGWRCGALWSTTIQGATRDGFPIPERRTMIVGRVPAVYAKTILRHKTIILLRIVHWCYRRRWSGWGRCWAHWTTIAIAMTTLPFPIPDRKIIGGVPTVFVSIVVVRKTKILTRIVHHRRCLIVTEKKSRRETTRPAATAATRINHREGAEQNTRRDHCAHSRNTVLLCCCHPILTQ